jgi:hypothetical protein
LKTSPQAGEGDNLLGHLVVLVVLGALLLTAGVSLLGCAAGSIDHVALSQTSGARFMNDLNVAGIRCFLTYGRQLDRGTAIVAVVEATVPEESAVTCKAIVNRVQAVAKRFGGMLGADTLDVRIVSAADHSEVLHEQTGFPLPTSDGDSTRQQ